MLTGLPINSALRQEFDDPMSLREVLLGLTPEDQAYLRARMADEDDLDAAAGLDGHRDLVDELQDLAREAAERDMGEDDDDDRPPPRPAPVQVAL